MSIKKTLQSDAWQKALQEEAELGNEDALFILAYMERQGWILKTTHPLPPLMAEKPKTEV